MGINFHELSEQWSEVNNYTDKSRKSHTEIITYRIYPDQMYTAGEYTIQINFDIRFDGFPWN